MGRVSDSFRTLNSLRKPEDIGALAEGKDGRVVGDPFYAVRVARPWRGTCLMGQHPYIPGSYLLGDL